MGKGEETNNEKGSPVTTDEPIISIEDGDSNLNDTSNPRGSGYTALLPARPAVTVARVMQRTGQLYIFGRTTDKVLSFNPEREFIPYYAKRINELNNVPQGADIKSALIDLQALMQEDNVNINYNLDKMYNDILRKYQLSEFVQNAVRMQFGKGLITPLAMLENVLSAPNKHTYNHWDPTGHKEITMALETLQAALVMQGVEVTHKINPKSGTQFAITHHSADEQNIPQKIVTGKGANGVVSLAFARDCPPELYGKAIVSFNDMAASSGQDRGNTIIFNNADKHLAVSILLPAVALFFHHKHVKLTEDYVASVDQKLAELGDDVSPEVKQWLQKLWQDVKTYSQAYDPRNKWSANMLDPDARQPIQITVYKGETTEELKATHASQQPKYKRALDALCDRRVQSATFQELLADPANFKNITIQPEELSPEREITGKFTPLGDNQTTDGQFTPAAPRSPGPT